MFQSTFKYESRFWTSKDGYQPGNGINLSQTETMLPTYWTVPFNKLCLVMLNNRDGKLRSLSIGYKGISLYDVIVGGEYQLIDLKVRDLITLIRQSASIQVIRYNVVTCRSLTIMSNWQFAEINILLDSIHSNLYNMT